MGGGSYSTTNRATRTEFYSKRSMHENFQERSMNLAMNPMNVGIRESRDSEEHPNSLAIIVALDVTGSMGSIPQYLVGKGLPHFMERLIKGGIPDPQVLFLGIGDHECDQAPLQVSQFESSDELLDHWLTKLYIEGHGGGNDGESYLLAWYFAGWHTDIDCFNKRKQKGFLFTIGDEKCLPSVNSHALKNIMGDGQYDKKSAYNVMLEKARERYNVYHMHLREGYNGNREEVRDEWKQIMGRNLLDVFNKKDVASIMADTIISNLLKSEVLATIPGSVEYAVEVSDGESML